MCLKCRSFSNISHQKSTTESKRYQQCPYSIPPIPFSLTPQIPDIPGYKKPKKSWKNPSSRSHFSFLWHFAWNGSLFCAGFPVWLWPCLRSRTLENLWNIKRGGNVNCKFATFDEEGSTRRARSAEASGRAWHFAEVRCQVRLCTVLGHQNWAQTDWTAGLRTPPDSVRARISWKELRAKSKARLGIQNVLKRRQWFKQIQRASYCQFSVF